MSVRLCVSGGHQLRLFQNHDVGVSRLGVVEILGARASGGHPGEFLLWVVLVRDINSVESALVPSETYRRSVRARYEGSVRTIVLRCARCTCAEVMRTVGDSRAVEVQQMYL